MKDAVARLSLDPLVTSFVGPAGRAVPSDEQHEEVLGIAEHRADDEAKAVAFPRLRQGETSLLTRAVNTLGAASQQAVNTVPLRSKPCQQPNPTFPTKMDATVNTTLCCAQGFEVC